MGCRRRQNPLVRMTPHTFVCSANIKDAPLDLLQSGTLQIACVVSAITTGLQRKRGLILRKCQDRKKWHKGATGRRKNFSANLNPVRFSLGMRRNSKTLHGNFPCLFCEAVITYAPDLAVHEQKHNGGVKVTNKINCPRCAECFRGVRAQQLYVAHFLDKHLSVPWATVICPICQKGSVRGDNKNANNVKRIHMYLYHYVFHLRSEQIPKCDQCPAYFKTVNFLQNHKIEIHGVKVPCDVCGKQFSTKETLRGQIRAAQKQDSTMFPIACKIPECTKRFLSEESMKRHVSYYHKDKKRDKCPSCNQLFISLTFKKHVQYCGKEKVKTKRFCCETCGKAFGGKDPLRLHLLTHTGPESWEFCCETCGKK